MFNSVFKCILALLFVLWMSNKAKEQLLAGVQCYSLKFDFRLSAVWVPFITCVHSALKSIIASHQNAFSDSWVKCGISVCWLVSHEDVDDRHALYDNARALQREGKLFVVKGEKSKGSAVDDVAAKKVLNPARPLALRIMMVMMMMNLICLRNRQRMRMPPRMMTC